MLAGSALASSPRCVHVPLLFHVIHPRGRLQCDAELIWVARLTILTLSAVFPVLQSYPACNVSVGRPWRGLLLLAVSYPCPPALQLYLPPPKGASARSRHVFLQALHLLVPELHYLLSFAKCTAPYQSFALSA